MPHRVDEALAAAWVPRPFLSAVDAVAKATQRSRSQLIRAALLEAMTPAPPPEEPTRGGRRT